MQFARLGLSIILILSFSSGSVASENTELQAIVDELKQITDRARQQRAADRWLLRDLEELVAKHDWPWREELLSEDFADGDYHQNPKWQVVSGQFWIDRRLGLRSRTHPLNEQVERENEQSNEKDLGKAILGALLQEALRDQKGSGDSRSQPESRHQQPAEIQLPISIPRVFATRLDFSIHNRPEESGQISISILQDNKGNYGYRLNLVTDAQPSIEIITLRRGHQQVIDTSDLSEVDDGNSHSLEWRRDTHGTMEIYLDGTRLIKSRDNTFRDPFKWLTVTNFAGDFALNFVGLHGRR